MKKTKYIENFKNRRRGSSKRHLAEHKEWLDIDGDPVCKAFTPLAWETAKEGGDWVEIKINVKAPVEAKLKRVRTKKPAQ